MPTEMHVFDIMGILCRSIRNLSRDCQKDLFQIYWSSPETASKIINECFAFLDQRNISYLSDMICWDLKKFKSF